MRAILTLAERHPSDLVFSLAGYSMELRMLLLSMAADPLPLAFSAASLVLAGRRG